ncbi:hypothetical protein BKA62DRAFT_671159 [Auriculariales sp. MPI-PUGE-AT-0066]|nr:hypothetical protein BKA62DRAFT_671159 [Auriculariales sp. MPI-PUGE-AT-0066]
MEVGRGVVELVRDEVSEVVVVMDDGAVIEDVTHGLFEFKTEVDARLVGGTPRVLKALLLELRGCLAVDGLWKEVRARVASHGAVEELAWSWGNCELDRSSPVSAKAGSSSGGESEGVRDAGRRCADTEEVEDKEEVGVTHVSDERAGEVEEEMVEGEEAQRTMAIAVDVGGVGSERIRPNHDLYTLTAIKNPQVIKKYILEELSAGWVSGPFSRRLSTFLDPFILARSAWCQKLEMHSSSTSFGIYQQRTVTAPPSVICSILTSSQQSGERLPTWKKCGVLRVAQQLNGPQGCWSGVLTNVGETIASSCMKLLLGAGRVRELERLSGFDMVLIYDIPTYVTIRDIIGLLAQLEAHMLERALTDVLGQCAKSDCVGVSEPMWIERASSEQKKRWGIMMGMLSRFGSLVQEGGWTARGCCEFPVPLTGCSKWGWGALGIVEVWQTPARGKVAGAVAQQRANRCSPFNLQSCRKPYGLFMYSHDLAAIHDFLADLSIPWQHDKCTKFANLVWYLGFDWDFAEKKVSHQEEAEAPQERVRCVEQATHRSGVDREPCRLTVSYCPLPLLFRVALQIPAPASLPPVGLH